MNNDSETIIKVKEILQIQDLGRSFELVGLTLAIRDEDERESFLFEVVRWLIKNEIWQKAYGTAQMMAENYEKSESLRLVADYLASIGHLEKAFSVFDESEKVALSENLAEWQQAELLHAVAVSLRRINAFFKADETWEKAVAVARKGENSNPQNSSDSSSVLAEIAEFFAAEEKIEKAFGIAYNIKSIPKKERALERVAQYSQNIKRVA